MIHGGVPFMDLREGQQFHFPAHPKPAQYRSGAYVKLSPRKYAPRRNEPAHRHPWNTYTHEVGSVDVHVDPGEVLSATDLAEVLHAVDQTRAQDRTVARHVAEELPAPGGGGAQHSAPFKVGDRVVDRSKLGSPP